MIWKFYEIDLICSFRVCALDNIEELARVSCCVPQYIRKGIAIASFILGRCFERGLGVKNESEHAISMYKKVNRVVFSFLQFIFSLSVFNTIPMFVN